MHCYTFTIGGVPDPQRDRGIALSMTPGHSVPVVVVGPKENGTIVPMDQSWYEGYEDWKRSTTHLHQDRGITLVPPTLLHCDVLGEKPQDYRLTKAGDGEDQKILIHLLPHSERIKYTGCYKIENHDEQTGKVRAAYPRIDDVVGIEHIASHGGEVLIIMYPGSGFRVTPGREGGPGFLMYRLSSSGKHPRLIDVTPAPARRRDELRAG